MIKPALLLAFLCSLTCALMCLDENGKPVDWFFMYKLPIIQGYTHLEDGIGYAYYDANSKTDTLSISKQTLKDVTALDHTLGPLYTKEKQNYIFGMYNDDPPYSSASSSFGHLKGVVAASENTGFWLIHSTPRFPFNSSDSYSFPDFAKIYGQHFLCVTYKTNEFEKIGKAIQTMRPKFYDTNIPQNFTKNLPTLIAALNGAYDNSANSQDIMLTSFYGKSFRHLSKTGKWGKCIYQDLISPSLNKDLLIENWMRPFTESHCPPEYNYANLNVRTISFTRDISFGYTKDHCKWAISTTGSWVCMGDMNRMASQTKRGGGSLCFEHVGLYKAMRSLVTETDSCRN
ncbi:hypothetical protein RCL1_001131 [Eukaryota sp. TZLM3-RCL]